MNAKMKTKRMSDLKDKLTKIYRDAIRKATPYREITEGIYAQVFGTPEYDSLPRHEKGILEGMSEAYYNILEGERQEDYGGS